MIFKATPQERMLAPDDLLDRPPAATLPRPDASQAATLLEVRFSAESGVTAAQVLEHVEADDSIAEGSVECLSCYVLAEDMQPNA